MSYSHKFYTSKMGLTYDDVLLVPRYNPIPSRLDVGISTKLGKRHALSVPIMSAAMCTVTEGSMVRAMDNNGGMGIVHRFQSLSDRVAQAKQSYSVNAGIAIGLTDSVEEIAATVPTWAMLCVDVAHADAKTVYAFTAKVVRACPVHTIMAGNVVTPTAATAFALLGVDIIKCGIGSGSICSTREVTGFGFPNLSALLEISQAVKIPIVADGGIRSSGDIAKALAAGASAVMIGNLLAGTDEAPGIVKMDHDGNYVKVYRGQASEGAQQDYKGGLKPRTVAEGVTGLVTYKGSVASVMDNLAGGLRSAFTYAGACNLKEFQEKTQFVRVSPTTMNAESKTRV